MRLKKISIYNSTIHVKDIISLKDMIILLLNKGMKGKIHVKGKLNNNDKYRDICFGIFDEVNKVMEVFRENGYSCTYTEFSVSYCESIPIQSLIN